MNASEIADTLDKAADLLWLRGRTTRRPVASDGSLCVIHAITLAATVTPDGLLVRDTVRGLLSAHLTSIGEAQWPSIWNDSLPVNAVNDAHVVDTLKQAAKRVREVACE